MAGFKNLPHRQWEVLRDLWIEYIPEIELTESYPSPTLWQLPDLQLGVSKPEDGMEIPYVNGTRESVFREVVILTRKFLYCRLAGRDGIARGFPTWGLMANYYACFYGAKALCNLLGVASIARQSKMFLDIFARREFKVGKTRQHVYDILVVHRLEDCLTHRILWGLTGRLCRTLGMPEHAREVWSQMRAVNFETLSHYRNSLIYDSAAWPNADDYIWCDLTKRLGHIDVWRFVECQGSVIKAEGEMYVVVAERLHAILEFMLGDVAKLAPALGSEATALREWRKG
jgi:hypothetical protein